ncbi:MAG: 4Fe-4S binding protein [Verrucomicrobia bacterium]|nr:4Fe-4S binding protein [Verrucomicrobiota bacterium]
MKNQFTRRGILGRLGGALAGLLAAPAARTAKAAVQKVFVTAGAPKGYDPDKHQWAMGLDINKCIGCGLCAEACKKENHVPEGPNFFRTWIERYVIKKPERGSSEARGEVIVDSPNGGIGGFPPLTISKDEIQHSFFVPKLCNACKHSPCAQPALAAAGSSTRSPTPPRNAPFAITASPTSSNRPAWRFVRPRPASLAT